MTDNIELPPVIQELRSVMDRVRAAQAAAGLIVNLARYEAETSETNQEFLSDFLSVIPVEPAYSSNYRSDTVADNFTVKDPVNVRITASFGMLLTSDGHTAAGLVIGERPLADTRIPMSEILIVGWERSLGEDNNWTTPAPVVHVVTVVTDHWGALRDQGINNLNKPYPTDTLMKLFQGRQGTFEFGSDQHAALGLPFAEYGYTTFSANDTARKVNKKAEYLDSKFSLSSSNLRYIDHSKRTLLSADFEQFDVMRHMEYIVAAYGVGEAFDEVKSKREAKMPVHPAESTFDLPGYRQAIEQSGSASLRLPLE